MPLIVSVCERLSKPAHPILPDLITRIGLASDDTDYKLLYRKHTKRINIKANMTHTVETNTIGQRFSNCGPRTTSGPRILPLWSF